jgi:hypothetical protein
MPETFNSIYDVPMTYSGLLDDVVQRHAITPEVDDDFFTRSIMRNVFFSGRILINDGYLVNHPAALSQLLREGSVLRKMISQDFVRVLARQEDPDAFASNPEKMAERGVNSFKKIVRRADWTDLKDELRRRASGWYAYGKVDPWPKLQMHEGFKKLFARVFDKSLDDLGLPDNSMFKMDDFQRRYEEHADFEAAPRTAVEEVAEAMHTEGVFDRAFVTALMNIANQCYHYNFAMCLTGDRKTPIVADTTLGLAFEDILDLDDAVEAELDNIPVLSIPKGFPLEDGRIFEALLEPGSNLSIAKHEFLAQVDKLFRNRSASSLDDDVKTLREAAEQYREYLAEHFSDFIGMKELAPRRHAMITFGFGRAGAVVGAENVMLAANLVAGRGVSSFLHRLTKPGRRQLMRVALDPRAGEQKNITFKGGDIHPRFASLAFDQKAVKNHVKDIPKFVR